MSWPISLSACPNRRPGSRRARTLMAGDSEKESGPMADVGLFAASTTSVIVSSHTHRHSRPIIRSCQCGNCLCFFWCRFGLLDFTRLPSSIPSTFFLHPVHNQDWNTSPQAVGTTTRRVAQRQLRCQWCPPTSPAALDLVPDSGLRVLVSLYSKLDHHASLAMLAALDRQPSQRVRDIRSAARHSSPNRCMTGSCAGPFSFTNPPGGHGSILYAQLRPSRVPILGLDQD